MCGEREVTGYTCPCLYRRLGAGVFEGIFEVGSAGDVDFLGAGREAGELAGLAGPV
jgi:hypothetical protein